MMCGNCHLLIINLDENNLAALQGIATNQINLLVRQVTSQSIIRKNLIPSSLM